MKILELAALPNNDAFDKDNNAWAQKYLESCGLPRFIQRRMAQYYVKRRLNAKDTRQIGNSNLGLREKVGLLVKIIDDSPLNAKQLLRGDERELLAVTVSNHCIELIQEYCLINEGTPNNPIIECYNEVASFAEKWGIEMPYKTTVSKPKKVEESKKLSADAKALILEAAQVAAEFALGYVCCEEFWCKKFNRMAARTNEHINIANGLVSEKSPYVSTSALTDFYNKRRQTLEYLNMMQIVSEDGEQVLNLADIVEKSVANPEKRFIEMMTRARGLKDVNEAAGNAAMMLTFTCPSKYHARKTIERGGKEITVPNSKWQGSTPKEAQEYLCGQWAKVRASLKRSGIEISALRVVEPHKDGTPHWHIGVFVRPDQKEELIKTCRYYALEVDGDEKGAKENRFHVLEMDPEKGDLVGYLIKYIAKNVNGQGMKGDENIDFESGLSASAGADRSVAWASKWGIRQFQFIGAESVTVWRELRRLKKPLTDSDIETVRGAADKGDWAEFTLQMSNTPLNIVREKKEQPNKYGEPVFEIVGVSHADEQITTRAERWSLRKKASDSELIGSGSDPRTRVNNCTESISDVVINTLNAMGIDSFAREMLYQGKMVNDGDRTLKIRNNRVIEI
ncbi:replication endonuclease [Psychrobium sp. nBUS_13]|uniref:replication endonuclease n=1 Tax=Psychrobium sp. nBUS_13 TaxID=3395319 RepID=UPI003EBAC05A